MALEDHAPPADLADEEMDLETPTNGSIDDSIKQRLRERRKEIGDKKPEDFDLPGFNGELVVTYHALPWEDHKQIAEQVEKSKNPKAELYGQMDTIIRATDNIRIRHNGALHPIPGSDGEPVKWDNVLGEFLGFDPQGSARRALWETFGGNEIIITTHFNEVTTWMQSVDKEAGEEFLGESKG